MVIPYLLQLNFYNFENFSLKRKRIEKAPHARSRGDKEEV
jgi:hypothetical protein